MQTEICQTIISLSHSFEGSRGSVVRFPSLQKKGVVGRLFSARALRLRILLPQLGSNLSEFGNFLMKRHLFEGFLGES